MSSANQSRLIRFPSIGMGRCRLRQCYAQAVCDQGSQSGRGAAERCREPSRPLRAMESQFFALIARHTLILGTEIGRSVWLANVFSNNTTPPRVEKAEGVPLLGLALSLCLMAAVAALAFVACAAL